MIYTLREDMLKHHKDYDEYYIIKEFSNSLDEEYVDTLLDYDKNRDSDYSKSYNITYNFFRVSVSCRKYSMEINEIDHNDILVID